MVRLAGAAGDRVVHASAVSHPEPYGPACRCAGEDNEPARPVRLLERIVGCSINTVDKLLRDAGEAALAYHDEHVRGVKAQRVQCDEIWSFVHAKAKNARASGLVYTFIVAGIGVTARVLPGAALVFPQETTETSLLVVAVLCVLMDIGAR
jgi:hypothetical protein